MFLQFKKKFAGSSESLLSDLLACTTVYEGMVVENPVLRVVFHMIDGREPKLHWCHAVTL